MNNFSPNMLKTFKECPQKYYYKYIQKIAAPQKSTPFEKGKKIHALANYYLQGEDISKLEKTLNSEEAATWEMLKSNKYFSMEYLKSEYNLSCKIDNFWVGGRLDALVKDGKNYYILDYKTGSLPKNPEFDYQTMVYLIAASKFFNDFEQLSFVYIDLKNNKTREIKFSRELNEQYTSELKKICSLINIANKYSQNKNACTFCEYAKFC